MLDIHGNEFPEIDIPEGNTIRAGKDFTRVYNNGIPAGRYGVAGARDYTEMIRLFRLGCGSLLIRSNDIPLWLYDMLRIKPNRRRGERRQRCSGACNPLTD